MSTKHIDWKQVESLIEAGCTDKEIASVLRMDEATFQYRYCQHYDARFKEHHLNIEAAGSAKLKYAMYQKAIDGNTTLLLWLGKVRLGQREPDISTVNAPNQQSLDQSHTIMQLKHEIVQLRDELDQYKSASDS